MSYKVRLVLWGCFFLLAYQLILSHMSWEANSKVVPSVSEGKALVFYDELHIPWVVDKVDATEDTIYLAYSQLGAVAVYNWEGKYKYSIAVHVARNGGMDIRCMNGLLYLHDFRGYELVFDGPDLIQVYSPDEKQHVMGWFAEPTSPVYIKNGKIFSNDGEYIMDVPR